MLATPLCVLALAMVCNGRPDSLLPGLADYTRQLTGAMVSQPLFQAFSQGTGDLLARTTYDATRLPIAIFRTIGAPGREPSLINLDNLADDTDKILEEYQSGEGNEDAVLSIDKLIKKYGYPVEKHMIITEDGYKLQMFRIPGKGPVVFLMHGLLGSADDFVIAGPESGMAYLLAEEGYDVWMGNARGNKHSRRHIKLEPSDSKFWDFSWHEIGYYDLPAMIDYVLDNTNKKSLKYIGHSQGTTSFFVMTSLKPEYNDKIAVMVALSPVVFMSHIKSPIVRLTSPSSAIFGEILKRLGVHEYLPDSSFIRIIKWILCGTSPVAEVVCMNPTLLISGFGFAELNITNLPVIQGHVPAGAALKQVLHYGQGFNSGEFRQYDYGASKNRKVYGRDIPPKYPLQKVRAPVSLIYSTEDWMAHPDDVETLRQRLGNVVDYYKVPHNQFSHLDFIWAKHFHKLIFRRLRKLLAAF